jgi:prepilin-type N-terminal cleavage/methylation domain-containing protein
VRSLFVRKTQSGFTLVDSLVAIAIMAGVFAALYALSGQCVYVINSGRELTSAQQVLQDRVEQLRNLQWAQVTDSNYLANNVFNQASQNGSYLNGLSETISVNAYPTGVSPAIQLTVSSGSVTINSTNSAIAQGSLVRIDITDAWTAGRTRERPFNFHINSSSQEHPMIPRLFRRASRAGFSLTEMIITITVVGIIFGAIVLGTSAFQNLFFAEDDFYQSTGRASWVEDPR